ncbi:MAG: hypothetical protein HRT87_01645 [Legionellales bacterium]|nr:hypothetical protein [Legionellales bacterium]
MKKYISNLAIALSLFSVVLTAQGDIDFFTFKDVCVLFMGTKTKASTPVAIAYQQNNYNSSNIDNASKLIIMRLVNSISMSDALIELNKNITTNKYGSNADVEAIKYFISNGQQGKANSTAGVNYNIMIAKSSHNSTQCRGTTEMLKEHYSGFATKLANDSEMKDFMNEFEESNKKDKSCNCCNCIIL